MKKGARILALILAILMLLAAVASSFAKAEAQWDKDVYAYGAGLNEEQINKTAELLKIKDINQVNKVIVKAEDIYKYLKINSSNESMISSIYAMKADKGNGVEIIITTPENITKVTGVEYTNAALTAGITDAKIHVGAYRPVTGTSALTGVYKAFELNGIKLDEKRVDAANEELETVNAIVQEHKDDEKFSIKNINNVIINVKDSLIQFKEEHKEKAPEEEIRKIVNNAVNKYELNNVITQVNVNNLVNYFQTFQNTPAIDSKELQNQLKTLEKDLKDKANELIEGAKDGYDKVKDGAKEKIDEAKDYINSDEAKGFFAKIGDFFKEIFSKIGEFFRNIFN